MVKKTESKISYLILFLTALGTMLLCTKSSPLYAFNDWFDANAFFTVGKGMFQGMVPYRDLFDHKGPILYVIHGIAWLISNNDFLGVWIFEIIACYFMLFYSYKTMCLFCDKKFIVLMPVLSAVIYSSNHMRHGDSVEEFCLPLLAYALYLSMRYFVKDIKIKNRELIIIGITSAIVLWMKYTILAFYIGWIIMPVLVLAWKKEWKEIGRMILMIGIGVMITTIPVLIYFAANHALGDLLKVYFYNNIFVYAGKKVTLMEKLELLAINMEYVTRMNKWTFRLIGIGILWLGIRGKWKALLQVAGITGVMMMVILTVKNLHGYYSLCFSFLAILGLCAVGEVVSLAVKLVKRIRLSKLNLGNSLELYKKLFMGALLGVSFVAMVGICYTEGYNISMLQYEKEDYPQYQFAEIINQSENPTLLNYGELDMGVYTTAGILPTTKYFCELNLNSKEMKKAQKRIVNKGKVEFVISWNKEYEWPLYEKIAETQFVYEGRDRVYYLYQLKE